MMLSKKLPTLLVFIVLTNLLISCSTPKELEYRDFKNLEVVKVGFAATTLKMELIYYNPNNFGLELNRTDLDVYINNSYLGKTAQEYQVSIPKRAEFSIPVSIDVDMKNLLKNGLATFLTNEVMVKVTGTIRVGKLNVFKTFNVNYEGKQQFSF
ncbi:LEA type 2 family protein [Ferruginibacter paludis]|uniref:LEA type 2 family protein n=1 Tax=Ferruginibacter paludis TaxID=1310417 RepID=UPI0025B38FF4|nr:LEA type 2 family protein [Ferruginibacter paludis]MDN3656944.1 LEA type 2 family protein [Ferruginibacter paludis]